jgi:hypothetical protein
MGGSAPRSEAFAKLVAKELNIDTPIKPIGKTERYSLFKVRSDGQRARERQPQPVSVTSHARTPLCVNTGWTCDQCQPWHGPTIALDFDARDCQAAASCQGHQRGFHTHWNLGWHWNRSRNRCGRFRGSQQRVEGRASVSGTWPSTRASNGAGQRTGMSRIVQYPHWSAADAWWIGW